MVSARYLEAKMKTSDSPTALAPFDADTAAALQLWVVLNRALRVVAEHARRDMERHGLGPTEFAVLEVLFLRGALTLGEVGERVLLTSGSVTYIVDKLQQRGLLERRTCAEDRRVCYAHLTRAGRSLIAEVFPQHARALNRAMDALTTDEKEIAAALLRRLARSAGETQ